MPIPISHYDAHRIRNKALEGLINPNVRKARHIVYPILKKASGRATCREYGKIIEKRGVKNER